ncbi:MAG TPA: C4-type zinc ribbon domain-containing protein [Vicinamibacterales bacterium]|nr:C4-type zinc ribbon domain-containing protein [Vicinamibacterales bacterium]
MHPDLERLIALQRLDTTAEAARKTLADEPERQKALDARLDAAKQRVAAAKEQLAGNQNARRAIEKELAVHQGRLSKFREQAMAVKTNQEYHAIQHEIAHAQTEIKKHEDGILERMLEADDLAAAAKKAEAEAAAEQKTVDAERKAMTADHGELLKSLENIGEERRTIVAALDKQMLLMFEQVAKRRHGIAVAEARDGICTICHVRLRPQVFNTVRRNDSIMQCDSCQRVLYFVPAPAPTTSASAVDPSAQPS